MTLATVKFQRHLIRLLRGVLSAWEEWLSEVNPGEKRPPSNT